MVNEFCGFKHGVIGTDKMPADTTLNNMKKADLIKLLHTAQHNYETLMWFYNNAVKANMSQLNNDGWIPCSERLPEEAYGCLVTVMNYEPMTGQEFENILPYFVGYDEYTWYDADGEEVPFEVIAWQPLPAPYQPSNPEIPNYWKEQTMSRFERVE